MNFSGPYLAHMAASLARGCAIWVCLLFAAFTAIPSQTAQTAQKESLHLVLRDAGGAALYSAPVLDGSLFAITYTHSVAQTPVTDYFLVKDKAIWLEGSVYHDFGAGLPHSPEHGQKLRQEHGRLIMSGYDRRLGSFDLRVGRVAGHELILFKGHDKDLAVTKTVPLGALVPGGGVINFSIDASREK